MYTYSYVKSILNSSELFSEIKKVLYGVINIVYNKDTKTIDITFFTELNQTEKGVLDDIILTFTSVPDVSFENISKYCGVFSLEAQSFSSGGDLSLKGFIYNDSDVFILNDESIQLQTKGRFLVYSHVLMEPHGKAMISLLRGSTYIDFPETTIYGKGLLFAPIQNILLGDKIVVRIQGDNVTVKNCYLFVVRSHINLDYYENNVFYASNTINNDTVTEWTDIVFDNVINQDPGYSTDNNNIVIITEGVYTLLCTVSSSESTEIRVLINDIEDETLRTDNNLGIMTSREITSPNTSIKIQAKGNALLKECNFLILKLQGASSLEKTLSDTIRPQFLVKYENQSNVTSAKYFTNVPGMIDKIRDQIYDGWSVTEDGLYLFNYQLKSSQENIFIKVSVNNKSILVYKANMCAYLLHLRKNDILGIQVCCEDDIVSTGSRMNMIRLEPGHKHKRIFSSCYSDTHTNSTEFVPKTFTNTHKMLVGKYLLHFKGNFKTLYSKKQFEIRLKLNDTVVYQNIFEAEKTLDIEKQIYFGNEESHIIVPEFRVLSSKDICVATEMAVSISKQS